MSALRKVLVVDDDPVVGKSFERVLSAKGYAVITAENGEQALNKLDSEQYDVVFTDIRMPGMDGLEVAERVKASQPWLPVVIVTGYGTQENEDRAEAAGVCGFLRKPLSPASIEYSTREALLKRDAAAVRQVAAESVETAPAAEVSEAFSPVAARRESRLKNIALFLAAPFVGLAYILAFPIVGLAMLAWTGAKAAARNPTLNRIGRVGLFVVSPLIGLAYVLLLPVVGLAMLVWMGVGALIKRSGPD
jgi:CheY-like chemotaxis protein